MKYQNLLKINGLVPVLVFSALSLTLVLALSGTRAEARSLSSGGPPEDVIDGAVEDNIEVAVEEAVEETV